MHWENVWGEISSFCRIPFSRLSLSWKAANFSHGIKEQFNAWHILHHTSITRWYWYTIWLLHHIHRRWYVFYFTSALFQVLINEPGVTPPFNSYILSDCFSDFMILRGGGGKALVRGEELGRTRCFSFFDFWKISLHHAIFSSAERLRDLPSKERTPKCLLVT